MNSFLQRFFGEILATGRENDEFRDDGSHLLLDREVFFFLHLLPESDDAFKKEWVKLEEERRNFIRLIGGEDLFVLLAEFLNRLYEDVNIIF